MIPGFDWICEGESRWRIPPIGLPGISLGSTKLSVIATHRAKM